MFAIGDNACGDRGMGKGGTQEPRFAMVQRRHGVEGVGDHGRSLVKGMGRFGSSGKGVAKADGDAEGPQVGDDGAAGVEFGGEGDYLDDGGVVAKDVLDGG